MPVRKKNKKREQLLSFLIHIGDGAGRFSYWFICDEIDGLLELIKDKIINA